MAKDRLATLLDSSNTTFNGIDFVEIVNTAQTTLRVHFLNTVAVQGTLVSSALGASNPSIAGGESIASVPVLPFDASNWSSDAEGRPLLTLQVAAPGDFSFYTLTILSSALDPFFNQVKFTFKALCDSDLDCGPTTAPCPPPPGPAAEITYLAKDFLSFRKALSDYSALSYPNWQERSEADFGMMFMEALSSLADDLSYMQDRIAAEAAIETATQRRSVVRLARLVDYEPKPATSASTILQFEVTASPIPSGLLVSATGADGSAIDFETGSGLVDPVTFLLNRTTYPVSPLWNRFTPDGCPNLCPYYWDDSQRCLLKGATEMWIEGHGFGLTEGQQLLIDTAAEITADPPVREIAVVKSAVEETDDLYLTAVTHITWKEPVQFNHDLTRTVLAGNLIPATQGRRYSEGFIIGQAPIGTQVPEAVQRTGPNGSAQFLYSLQNAPLAWLPQADPDSEPLPEIVLSGQPADPSESPEDWVWRRSLLSAETFEQSFTVDPWSLRKLGVNSDGSVAYDYDGEEGAVIRFGDSVFGEIPEDNSVFQVTYRAGGGTAGNVAADTISKVSPTGSSYVSAVTNPFAATGGADEETNQQVLRRAPQRFRTVQYRAVRPEDYEAAAETLPWVLRAGTVFRWTGSWLTVFTTAEPVGAGPIPIGNHIELIDLLNRYRMAGYESYTPAPVYVGIDLIVTVCACPSSFRGDIEAAVIRALSTDLFANGSSGFFYLGRFNFGAPLERSALEAAIQAANGVAGVISILYRERGVTPSWTTLPETLTVKPNQILRMDNDPSRPERGTLQVVVEGGK